MIRILTPLLLTLVLGLASCKQAHTPTLFLELPDDCNTPDGCTLDAQGNIILSCPNFNNDALVKAGLLKKPAPAKLVRITPDGKLTTWYQFKPCDLHPETGKVGPMDCAFGPDGHLYLADNQGPFKSRLLRIRVADGRAVSCEPVVVGFGVANAVAWKGDTIYISDTILIPADKEKGTKLISGVYAIPRSDWANGPVKLAKPTATTGDPRLITCLESSGRIGFGADGLTFDGEGNLYCSIFEDGVIYRIPFDKRGNPLKPRLFAKDPKMHSADGIMWRAADNRIYVADMLINGVQVVSMDGSVETLHRNGDTDGSDGLLDEPCEVQVIGNRLLIVNMDWWWDCPLLTNTKTDRPFTLSVIELD